MNILFVSSEFPLAKDQATGGIGTYLLNITKALVEQGHRVTVITQGRGISKHKNVKVVFCNFGEKFITFLRKIFRFALVKRLLNFIEYPLFFSFGAYLKINKLVKEQKIDIIEGNDFGGELFFYLLLSKKRPPVVLRLHTPSFVIQKFNKEPLTLFYRLMKFLEIYCLKKADSLYSPTKSLAQIISGEIKKPVKKIIPYPFKPLYIFPSIKRKDNIVLYVGKLQPKKGVFLLAEAVPLILKKLPKTLFYFVGPDTLQNGVSVRNLMMKKLKKLGVSESVIFFGEVKKRELYKLYQTVTMIVIPSLWENFPNVCLEAMSQGCLVVASKKGGLKELIKDNENGILIKRINSLMIADRIISLLRNNQMINEICKKAHRKVKSFYDQKKITEDTASYYQSIIYLN